MPSVDTDSAVIYRVPFTDIRITLAAVKYTCFLLCGVASLWPWNCFLSAADYFQDKLASSPTLAANYSSTMMSVSTLTSTLFNFYLTRNQKGVNYAKRLKIGNYIQMAVFLVMTISVTIPDSWTVFYFMFVMVNVLLTSIGSCLTQVGMMALVNMQPSSIYANATVVGNAVAGVLPSIAMIVAVLSNPAIQLYSEPGAATKSADSQTGSRSNEAVKYFVTSILMAIVAQLSIFLMEHCEKKVYFRLPSSGVIRGDGGTGDAEIEDIGETGGAYVNDEDTTEELEEALGQVSKIDDEFVGFSQLWSKLKYVESTIILTFCLTLIFPVFAASVESTNNLSKKIFVPLAFLVWNIGDLVGRIMCASEYCLIKAEKVLIAYSLSRLIFLPLFLMCNIEDRGSKIGDLGYMAIQLLFGITNGQLFSSSYMRVAELLSTGAEKKAAAAFTALLINLSLLVGSIASFLVVYFCISR